MERSLTVIEGFAVDIKRKLIATAATVLIFSIVGVGQATADGIEVTISSEEPFADFSARSAGGAYQVNVARGDGDPSVQFYSGKAPMDYYTGGNLEATPNLVNENDDFFGLSSQISGTVTSGNYTIRVSWCGWFCYAFPETVPEGNIPYIQTYILTYTGLTDVTRVPSIYYRNSRTSNALRVDSFATITEKANVVSCTPGKYTFLNGGGSEENSSLDALIYSLVINGKVVSRLGVGSYSSLPAHLFPTITQTVQGTADMKGAMWDLSTLRNYDARCEVHAWQSGANIQLATEQISDTVRTAENAAKAQAWEAQRAAATAANFTAEARAMRKRIAARQP